MKKAQDTHEHTQLLYTSTSKLENNPHDMLNAPGHHVKVGKKLCIYQMQTKRGTQEHNAGYCNNCNGISHHERHSMGLQGELDTITLNKITVKLVQMK